MASVAWVWVTPGAAMVHSVPPLNSMPRFRPPRRMMVTIPRTMMADDRREPDFAPADDVEPCLAPVEAGDRAVTPPGLGQQRPGGVIQADQLLFVEVVGSTPSSSSSTSSSLTSSSAAAVFVARAPLSLGSHEPPPPATLRPAPQAPTGSPGSAGPAPSPVAMLKIPEPCRRALCPSRMTSGRGVEPGDGHVHDGRQTEEEGEALHVPPTATK